MDFDMLVVDNELRSTNGTDFDSDSDSNSIGIEGDSGEIVIITLIVLAIVFPFILVGVYLIRKRRLNYLKLNHIEEEDEFGELDDEYRVPDDVTGWGELKK